MAEPRLARLYCDCTVSLIRSDGQRAQVRSRRWDCPSCGLDKANRLREIVMTANTERLFVLTFEQPRAERVEPERHRLCDAASHLYLYRDGTWRWRMLETCPHCCAWSSHALTLWRKAMRRRWPDLQFLWVREVKPASGAFDLNVVVKGLPPMTRRGAAGRTAKRLWTEAGGGFLDLGDKFSGARSSGALGRYVGKYLTKLAHRRMAKGYRRWGRTSDFAPEVRMTDPPFIGPRLPFSWQFDGWVNVLSGEVAEFRPDLRTLVGYVT